MDITKTVRNFATEWWHETKANAVSYINMTIILGVVNAGAYVASGYMQARAIDMAVDRMMQPVERIELRIDGLHGKVDAVLNDVSEVTGNAKKITGKIKAVEMKKVTPSAVKEAIKKAPQAKVLPKVQDIRDYWKKSAPEKKN